MSATLAWCVKYIDTRIIDELGPGWVVIENVPGLLSSAGGRDFATIIRWMAERGYGTSWRILDSQYFGVAQRRRRVFIVGSLGTGRSAQVLFESEGGAGDIETGREAGNPTSETFTIRSGSDGGGKGYLGAEELSLPIGPQGVYLNQVDVIRLNQTGSNGSGVGPQDVSNTLDGDSRQAVMQRTVGALQARDGKGIGTTIDDKMIWEPRSQDGTPRLHKDGISPTLNTAGGGQRQPMVGVRRLTPLECERLQGFPDGWTDGQADSSRYKQLGNAVTVSVAQWIGKRIMKVGGQS